MLSDVIEFLACPACGEELGVSGGIASCANRHSYDVARQGYLNLLAGRKQPGTADTAEMLDARASLLDSGLFEPLASAVVSAASAAGLVAAGGEGAPGLREKPGGTLIVDAGAGTGYYLARVLEALPGAHGLALDISKHAARRAARAHERIGAVVADTWGRLPVRDGVAALVLDIFAPRNGAEFARVLSPGGALLVVTPTRRHLAELVDIAGTVRVDERKPERLERELEGAFTPTSSTTVESPLALSREQAGALLSMGPSARHDRDGWAGALSGLDGPISTRLSAVVAVYRRR